MAGEGAVAEQEMKKAAEAAFQVIRENSALLA
jgi:hypothetical protein